MNVVDPFQLKRLLWPSVKFYKQQIEIIESVRDNDETFVCAGNMLGKDFVAAFIVLWFILTRSPVRVITTSMKEDHLDVLWGEMKEFIRTSAMELTVENGGPLLVLSREIRIWIGGHEVAKSYVKGFVSSDRTVESFQGHHLDRSDGIPHTLGVGDEASALPDDRYAMMQTWMHRGLFFGNPWPCNNFFKKAFKGDPNTSQPGGDIPRD